MVHLGNNRDMKFGPEIPPNLKVTIIPDTENP